MLGNPAPSVSHSNPMSSAASPADLTACEQKAKLDLNLVESEPVTSVQVLSKHVEVF